LPVTDKIVGIDFFFIIILIPLYSTIALTCCYALDVLISPDSACHEISLFNKN